jgi:hypothetical protein
LLLINFLKKGVNHPGGCRMIYINLDLRVARALKNNQLTGGERHAISGTGH